MGRSRLAPELSRAGAGGSPPIEPVGVSSSVDDAWGPVVRTTSVAWGEVLESPTARGNKGESIYGAAATKNQDGSTEGGSWTPPPCSNRGERRGERCPLSQEPALSQRGQFMAEESERAP